MGSLRMIGTRSNKMDAKGRVAIPAKWRDQLGDDVIITIGAEGCLYVYREEDFDALADKLAVNPFYSDEDVRKMKRNMLGNGEELTLDKQGRVLLTPEHRKYAGLEGEMDVTVKGVGDHLEIWNPDNWEAYNEGFDMSQSSKALASSGM